MEAKILVKICSKKYVLSLKSIYLFLFVCLRKRRLCTLYLMDSLVFFAETAGLAEEWEESGLAHKGSEEVYSSEQEA